MSLLIVFLVSTSCRSRRRAMEIASTVSYNDVPQYWDLSNFDPPSTRRRLGHKGSFVARCELAENPDIAGNSDASLIKSAMSENFASDTGPIARTYPRNKQLKLDKCLG